MCRVTRGPTGMPTEPCRGRRDPAVPWAPSATGAARVPPAWTERVASAAPSAPGVPPASPAHPAPEGPWVQWAGPVRQPFPHPPSSEEAVVGGTDALYCPCPKRHRFVHPTAGYGLPFALPPASPSDGYGSHEEPAQQPVTPLLRQPSSSTWG